MIDQSDSMDESPIPRSSSVKAGGIPSKEGVCQLLSLSLQFRKEPNEQNFDKVW